MRLGRCRTSLRGNINLNDLRLNRCSLPCRLHRRMRGLGTLMRSEGADASHVTDIVNGESLLDDIDIQGDSIIYV